MIHVDISNIWGELSLQDLLGIEQEIFAAHANATQWESCTEMERILKAAETIRTQSQVCVVLGSDAGCHSSRAVMELLQGPNRNHFEKGPEVYFAGSSLSTRQWNELKELLEGKDFSLIVVSRNEMSQACAAVLRGLKWILERKQGTDECRRRIFAVTNGPDTNLGQMADSHGWETFFSEKCSALTPAGLLPMAVAGIDIEQLTQSAAEAAAEYDLRSFENPVWLYTAVRKLMGRCGKTAEHLVSWEPGFRCLGHWWQHMLLECEDGPIPVVLEFPADAPIAQSSRFFETILRFAPDDRPHIIGYDICDLDGLNAFADATLDSLEEQDYLTTLETHTDQGIPYISLECGDLNEETAGALLVFLELTKALSCPEPELVGNPND